MDSLRAASGSPTTQFLSRILRIATATGHLSDSTPLKLTASSLP
jgi:hypothetical protein